MTHQDMSKILPLRTRDGSSLPSPVTLASGFGGGEKSFKNNVVELPRHGPKKENLERLSRSAVTFEKSEKRNRVPVSPYEAAAPEAEMLADIRKRPRQLPTLYPASAAALESVVRRAGKDVHKSWRGRAGLANFLRDMGRPKRHERESVDRLNPHDPAYGPGLCRWANDETQANNRTTTVLIYDPETKEYEARAIVARRHGLRPETVRQAMQRGADPAHVIEEMKARTPEKAGSRGKLKLSPKPAEAPLNNDKPTVPAPSAAPKQAHDPARRWPWSLTKAQRDNWEQAYMQGRNPKPDGFEWRCEYAVRQSAYTRDYMLKKMHELEAKWGGEPDTPEEEAAWERLEAERAHFQQRSNEAEAALPGILAELRGRKRDRTEA